MRGPTPLPTPLARPPRGGALLFGMALWILFAAVAGGGFQFGYARGHAACGPEARP